METIWFSPSYKLRKFNRDDGSQCPELSAKLFWGRTHSKMSLLHYTRLFTYPISLISTLSRSEIVDEFLKSKCDTPIMEYL